jgi:predicted ATP-binding protein involved in virulence
MSEPFISELHLQNFKCYEDLTLHLKSGVNLLYGVNGSGKTTILEGLCIASSAFFSKLPFESNRSKSQLETEHFRLKPVGGMPMPEFQFPVGLNVIGNVLGSKFGWGCDMSFLHSIPFPYSVEIEEKSEDAAKIAQNGRREVLPVVAYFSTERLFVSQKEDVPRPIGRSLGYHNALENSNIQKLVRDWLKDAEFLEYQRKRSDSHYFDQGLKGIKKLVLEVLENRWKELYYYEPAASSGLPKGLFLVPHDKENSTLPESGLSDGYRNLLWLFLEIAWRCYVLNPYLGENAAAETNGIVMIDEVDLHLHPEWQQKVLGMLTKAFPKIQFVITTHSPIVLGSVKEGQVILLEGQTATVVDAPYGLKPSYILEVLMKVKERLPELQEPIDQYFEFLNNGSGRSEAAKALRQQLESLMSPHDPMFLEADVLIDFLSTEEN